MVNPVKKLRRIFNRTVKQVAAASLLTAMLVSGASAAQLDRNQAPEAPDNATGLTQAFNETSSDGRTGILVFIDPARIPADAADNDPGLKQGKTSRLSNGALIKGEAAIAAYEEGVEQASDIPVIYIDPKEFTGDMQKDIEILREQLKKQAPGFLANSTDAELAGWVWISRTAGPFAAQIPYNNGTYCLVNKPPFFMDEKDEIAALISGVDKDLLGYIPGTDILWNRAVGIHEGTHCSQPYEDPEDSYNIFFPDWVQILTDEARADRAALDDLESNGLYEMAQAYIDYRALAASQDPGHATSALVDDKGEITATDKHLETAITLMDTMSTGVSIVLGMELTEARELLGKNPEKFITTIDELLEAGVYDNTPILKEYIEDYAGAYRRQILDPDPKSAVTIPAPKSSSVTPPAPKPLVVMTPVSEPAIMVPGPETTLKNVRIFPPFVNMGKNAEASSKYPAFIAIEPAPEEPLRDIRIFPPFAGPGGDSGTGSKYPGLGIK